MASKCSSAIFTQLRLLFVLLFLLVLSTTSHSAFNFKDFAQQEPEFLPVNEAFVFDSAITSQGLTISWNIAEGYYLYQSKIELTSIDDQATLGEPWYSDPGIEEEDPYFGKTRVVYNTLELKLPLSLVGNNTDSEIQITYQGCATAGLCYPPETRNVLFIPPIEKPENGVNSAGVEHASGPNETGGDSIKRMDGEDASSIFSFMGEASINTIILTFFLLGLGLTFTPCVLPMIPIITSIVAGPQGKDAGFIRNFGLASSYVLGMSLTYAILGLAMGLLGAEANMQAAMQSPAVLITFSVIFVALALAMFGAYELRLPTFIQNKLEAESRKLSGGKVASVFGIGALSALLVSPCVSAPLAGALLYISTSSDAVLGFSALFALGLGMGVPLILVAVGGARFLPKSGPWLDASKFIFGMLLLGVSVWLVARLIPGHVALGIWALLALATSVYMGAFDAAQSQLLKLKKTLALAIFVVACIWLVGAFSGASNPAQPFEKLSLKTNASTHLLSNFEFNEVKGLNELNKQLEEAAKQGKVAFVDVYADWCISCIIMEREIFPQPDVKPLLDKMYLIKADVTRNDAGNIELLKHYGLFGPPSYLFFDTKGQEIDTQRIVGEISKDKFIERLEAALRAG